MNIPFNKLEIEKAIKSLKNNKSPGIDDLKAELIKHAPKIVYEEIAEILNITAKSGVFPKELRTGILTPLQKPGKKIGPPESLRPIILLSNLRKILAITILNRCWDKIKTKIPLSQAAYQSGRSTTENIFAFKLLAEKAITTEN